MTVLAIATIHKCSQDPEQHKRLLELIIEYGLDYFAVDYIDYLAIAYQDDKIKQYDAYMHTMQLKARLLWEKVHEKT